MGKKQIHWDNFLQVHTYYTRDQHDPQHLSGDCPTRLTHQPNSSPFLRNREPGGNVTEIAVRCTTSISWKVRLTPAALELVLKLALNESFKRALSMLEN